MKEYLFSSIPYQTKRLAAACKTYCSIGADYWDEEGPEYVFNAYVAGDESRKPIFVRAGTPEQAAEKAIACFNKMKEANDAS